jgi:hypothetical protein
MNQRLTLADETVVTLQTFRQSLVQVGRVAQAAVVHGVVYS